jgi:hypothetical protein
MKKIYLLAAAALLSVGTFAQNTYKFSKKEIAKGKVTSAERVSGGINSVQQVAGSITCNTQYVAGTSMTLNLKLTLSNTDEEYVDQLTITFPAGITPTAAVNPFPGSQTGGQPAEALNPISGQVVSWGDNDNSYGGIQTPAPNGAPVSYNFTVDVTVGSSVTGNQTATYVASGDGFGASPGDLNGSFIIYPAGASLPNLSVTALLPLNLTDFIVCNYGVDTIVGQVKNFGNTTESNITIYGKVNGTSIPVSVVPGPLAPGDSSFFIFLPGYNFSASNVYDLVAYTSIAGDVNLSDDTVKFSFVNNASTPLTSTSYFNGVESNYDLNSITVSGTAAPYTGLSTATIFSGSQALFTTVGTTATAGTYEVYLALPCVDVVAGETYKISYMRKVNNNPATHRGSGGIFTGLSPDGATMTAIKPYSVITPTGAGAANWTKDSVEYTATATETRYFAVSGQGTVSGSISFNFRVDDIKISKVTPTSVKEIANSAIKVYPNPNNGVFTVASPVASNMEVINVLGSVVYSAKVNVGNNNVNLTGLTPGTYFVKVNNQVSRVIVK